MEIAEMTFNNLAHSEGKAYTVSTVCGNRITEINK